MATKSPSSLMVTGLVISVAVIGLPCLADEAQDASRRPIVGQELLALCELMAAEAKSNYDRIQTWKGRFRLTDKQRLKGIPGVNGNRYTGIVWQNNIGFAQFAVDVPADKLYCDYVTEGPPAYFTDEGIQVAEIGGSRIAEQTVVTPEHYLSFQPGIHYGPVDNSDLPPQELSGRLAFRRGSAEVTNKKTMSSVIDPRRLFGEGSTDRLFFQVYELYARRLRRTDTDIPFSVVEVGEGDRRRSFEIEMHFKNPFGYASVARCLVGSETNYNMKWFKYWNDGDQQLNREQSWEYTTVDDMVLPKIFRMKCWDLDTGEFYRDRELELEESILNAPLADVTFDYASFNLRRGDRVQDDIEKRLWVVDADGNLVSPEDFRSTIR